MKNTNARQWKNKPSFHVSSRMNATSNPCATDKLYLPLLVDTNVIHLHALWPDRLINTFFSSPVTTHSKIQYKVERLIKRPAFEVLLRIAVYSIVYLLVN